jgi:hypothetical protein
MAHEHAAAHHLLRRIIWCGTSSAAAHHLLRRIICCGASSAAAHHLLRHIICCGASSGASAAYHGYLSLYPLYVGVHICMCV